ncbi:hypothetical protein [Bounagaea algeriensis]
MSGENSAPRRRTGALVVTSLCGLSLVACAGTGIAWAVSAHDSEVQRAQVRDEALQAGQAAVANFNSLDHRKLQQGLDRWEQSSTGALHQEVQQGRQQYAEQIKQRKSITEAKVLDAGLTELDEQSGKARMITVVQVTVRAERQQPSTQRHRYAAQLSRDGEDWKLARISQVPNGAQEPNESQQNGGQQNGGQQNGGQQNGSGGGSGQGPGASGQ